MKTFNKFHLPLQYQIEHVWKEFEKYWHIIINDIYISNYGAELLNLHTRNERNSNRTSSILRQDIKIGILNT